VDRGIARPVGGETPVFRTLHWSAWLGEKSPIPADLTWGPRSPLREDTTAPRRPKEAEPPPCPWLLDARLNDASQVSVVGSKVQRGAPWTTSQRETERFIYYDGLVPAPNHLRCVKASPDSVTVRNSADFSIRDLFVVDRRLTRARAMAFAHVPGPIAAWEERAVSLRPVPADAWQASAVEPVSKALVAAGLTEAEAKAVLKIWDQGFFGAPGVTAFYLLPQAEYDRMLPLEISPKPRKLVRVAIALHPHFAIEPGLTQQAERLMAQLADPEAAKRDAAAKDLAQLGPVAWRLMRETIQKSPASELAKRLDDILKATDASDWLRQAAKEYKF
jgi:hypothetical protein